MSSERCLCDPAYQGVHCPLHDGPRYKLLPRRGNFTEVRDTHTGEIGRLADILAVAKGVDIDDLDEVVAFLWGDEVAA